MVIKWPWFVLLLDELSAHVCLQLFLKSLAIGKLTLQNMFHLDFITVELDLTVIIKASSKEDSIIEVTDPNRQITETVRIDFGVDDLDIGQATPAVLAALGHRVGRSDVVETGWFYLHWPARR